MWSISLWRRGSGHEYAIYSTKEVAEEAYDNSRASAKLLYCGRRIQKSSGLARWVISAKQYWEVAHELTELGRSLDELTENIQELSRWSVTYHWGRSGHHFVSYESEQEARKAYKKVSPFATKILRHGREVIASYAPLCLFHFWGKALTQYSLLCLSVMEHQDTLAGSLYSPPMELKSWDHRLVECTSPASPSSLVSSYESDTVLADSVLGDSIPLVFYY